MSPASATEHAPVMDSVRLDLRAGIRVLRRRPGFAALTVATLAISIGLSTSVFTTIYSVLLRPLPYANPDRLVLITHQTAGGEALGAVSSPDMLDYRDESRLLADVAAVNSFGASLTGDDGEAEQIQLGVVTGNFFSVLGVQPRYGRAFEAADDTPLDTRDPRNSSVIILGHGLWQRRYGGDPGVIGRTIRVGGTPMIVVGILPPRFRLYMPSGVSMVTQLDAWTPLRVPYATAPREGAYLKLIGRHQVQNSLAALAVAREFGVDPKAAVAALEAQRPSKGRMEVRTVHGATLLADCYNANPDATRAALGTLASWPKARRRIAVLGDMLELGADAARLHRETGGEVKDAALWVVGAHADDYAAGAKRAGVEVRVFADKPALAEALRAELAPGTVVLIKASRGAALEEVFELLGPAAPGER